MIINPHKRYLLTRPRGGLNDSLVQLEKTRRYAEIHGRTLIIDFSRSGLACNLEELFVLRANFGCDVIFCSAPLEAELDTLTSVYPVSLKNRVSSYQTKWHSANKIYFDDLMHSAVTFDFNKGYGEQLLIHEQPGGGLIALCVLRRLAFTKTIADLILSRLISIGQDYDAIHIRNSDYKTNYDDLFVQAKRLFRGRRLLICSDSHDVKSDAETYFDGIIDILSIADIPDTGGVPLHETADIDRHAANIDLFSEIIAMARARKFLFTKLSPENDLGFYYPFSGIAFVVETLRADPGVVNALFDKADAKLINLLFTEAPRQNFRVDLYSTVVRLYAQCFEYKWNLPAIRKSAQIRRKVRRRPQIEDLT